MALFPGALIPWIEMRFLDQNGDPLVGGKLHTFLANTSTPEPTYTDSDLTTPHANPIILDAFGRPPSPIFLGPTGYKFVLDDVDDVEQYSIDHIQNVGQVFASQFGLIFGEGGKDVASGYEVVVTDRLVTVDGTGGPDPCVVNLLASSDATQQLTIKNLGSVAVAITPNGIDTIDGEASVFTLPAASSVFPSVTLIPDGVSAWFIVSSHALS